MELSGSIYQLLNQREVPLDVFGAMQQGQQSAFGQLALQEARWQRQVEAQTRARLKQAYAQGGTGFSPGAGLESRAPGAPASAVQETVNTPYSSDLQTMLSQYQQEYPGEGVTPQPGPRVLPGAPARAPGSTIGQALGPQPRGVFTPEVIRDLGMIDPDTALRVERSARDSQRANLEMVGKQNAMVSQVARSILLQDTQQSYEVGVRTLQQMGIPVDHLPAMYDRRMVEHYYGMATDAETRINEAKTQLYGAEAGLAQAKAGRERGKAPDYGYGEDVNQVLYARFGDQIAPGERPTPQQVREAREEYLRTDPQQRLRSAQATREDYEAKAVRGVQDVEPGATAGPRAMSETDVQDAMTQTGKTRAEVVEAARARGFTTPGRPAPGSSPGQAPYGETGAAAVQAPAAVAAPAPVAAPAVPQPAAAPARVAAAAPSPRVQADEQRLRRLEELRKGQEDHIERLKPLATSDAGSKRLAAAERELERRNAEINRLHDRIYERGPEKQQRALELEEAKPLAEERGRRAAREEMSLQEFYKGQDEATRFVDTTTGTPISPASNYLTTEQRQGAGDAKLLSKEEYDQYRSIRTALPIMKKIQQYYDKIYGEGGVFAGLTAQDWGRLSTMTWKEAAERYPLLAAADKYIRTNAEALARGLRGMKGPATEGDVQRMLDAFGDLRSGLEFAAWPPKLAYHTPSSRGVALRALDDQIETLNEITGTLLENPAFEHAGLHRYFRPEQQETAPSAAQPPSTGTPQAVPQGPVPRPGDRGYPYTPGLGGRLQP